MKACFVVEGVDGLISLLDAMNFEDAEIFVVALGAEEVARAASCVASSVHWVDCAGQSPECYVEAAVDRVQCCGASVFAGIATEATRQVLARVALAQETSLISNVVAARADGPSCVVQRSISDDQVIVQLRADRGACLLMNPLCVAESSSIEGEPSAPIEAVSAQATVPYETLGVAPVAASKVESAARVVGGGYGVRQPETFDLVKRLAETLGAEVGGSMNLVEDTDLLKDERYIGLSGMRIAPDLYVAVGISGAAQHVAGIRNAKTVVAINKDPKAKVFERADYGIVGDASDVLPELIGALS